MKNGKIIGVVGNRVGWEYELVRAVLKNLDITRKTCVMVSGGAIGVDSHAQRYAKENGIPFLIIYPNLSLPSPMRYFNRNDMIIGLCDEIIAFHKGHSYGGTHYIIKKGGEKVQVIT